MKPFFDSTAKDGSEHPTFENHQCLQALLEHSARFMSVEYYRSYNLFVHGTFGEGVTAASSGIISGG